MANNHDGVGKEFVPLDVVDGGGDTNHDEVESAGLFGSAAIKTDHLTLGVEDLKALMENRGHDAVNVIDDLYGGVHELCKRLQTNESFGKVLLMLACC